MKRKLASYSWIITLTLLPAAAMIAVPAIGVFWLAMASMIVITFKTTIPWFISYVGVYALTVIGFYAIACLMSIYPWLRPQTRNT